MTKENLGAWITDNSKQDFDDNEEIELTKVEVAELEHKSSLASRALDRLKAVEDFFKMYIQNGTPTISDVLQPIDITIPPTEGTKILKSRREFADKLIEQGYRVETTHLFTIPYPEKKKMVVVDIVGNEWATYTKDMTKSEIEMYGGLFATDVEMKQTNGKAKPKREPLL
jgi:hypothetical protein